MSKKFHTFAAIDFETANNSHDSACAVGVVIASKGKIVKTIYKLIKPPDSYFIHTDTHGITWDHVKNEETFDKVWEDIEKEIKDVEFLAAHNAKFDEKVLDACCKRYKLTNLNIPFVCTMNIAKTSWGMKTTNLKYVCKRLGIKFQHHYALDDAKACAQIVIKDQLRRDWPLPPPLRNEE